MNRGADLNRNFEFDWNDTNGKGSSGNQCNETYRGPSGGSEPETQAVLALVEEAAPALILDLHAPLELIAPTPDANIPERLF